MIHNHDNDNIGIWRWNKDVKSNAINGRPRSWRKNYTRLKIDEGLNVITIEQLILFMVLYWLEIMIR